MFFRAQQCARFLSGGGKIAAGSLQCPRAFQAADNRVRETRIVEVEIPRVEFPVGRHRCKLARHIRDRQVPAIHQARMNMAFSGCLAMHWGYAAIPGRREMAWIGRYGLAG